MTVMHFSGISKTLSNMYDGACFAKRFNDLKLHHRCLVGSFIFSHKNDSIISKNLPPRRTLYNITLDGSIQHKIAPNDREKICKMKSTFLHILLCVTILFHHLVCVYELHLSCVYAVMLSYHHSTFVVFTNQSPSHSFHLPM